MLKVNISRAFLLFSLLILAVINDSCATGTYLKTAKAPGIEGDGKFSLILYGDEFLNNPLRAAILDLEGDAYIFEVRASGYKYTVKSGVPVKEALIDAQLFISRHSHYLSSRFQKIINDNGKIVGYELRPLYLRGAFGLSDILNVRYREEDKKVIVSVDIKRTFKNKNIEIDYDR